MSLNYVYSNYYHFPPKSSEVIWCVKSQSPDSQNLSSVTLTLKSKEMRIREENVLSCDENNVTVQANRLHFLYANIISYYLSMDTRVKYELLTWDWLINVVLCKCKWKAEKLILLIDLCSLFVWFLGKPCCQGQNFSINFYKCTFWWSLMFKKHNKQFSLENIELEKNHNKIIHFVLICPVLLDECIY